MFGCLLAVVLGGVTVAGWMRGEPVVPVVARQATVNAPAFDHEHAAWSTVLATFVHDGVVDYAGLERRGQPGLTAYLDQLGRQAGQQGSWSRAEQMAYWINAYNAFTIRLILDNYPLDSIRSIGFLPGAAFRRSFIPLGPGGRSLSLDDIEHRILRPQFEDARIHFAIVCASVSCPILQSEAYRASVLGAQLDHAARRFLSDSTRNRLDQASNTLYLSSIFDWFQEDFERDGRSVEAYVARYLTESDARALRAGSYKTRFLDYDWSLNGRE